LNVDAISIVYAYKAPSPHPSRCATCQPIIATAGARSAGIGVRLPFTIHYDLLTEACSQVCCQDVSPVTVLNQIKGLFNTAAVNILD